MLPIFEKVAADETLRGKSLARDQVLKTELELTARLDAYLASLANHAPIPDDALDAAANETEAVALLLHTSGVADAETVTEAGRFARGAAVLRQAGALRRRVSEGVAIAVHSDRFSLAHSSATLRLADRSVEALRDEHRAERSVEEDGGGGSFERGSSVANLPVFTKRLNVVREDLIEAFLKVCPSTLISQCILKGFSANETYHTIGSYW